MRLPAVEHTGRRWRVHELTADFRLEGVWSCRTPGAGRDDFPVVLDALRAAGGLDENPAIVRLASAVRSRLGAVFGGDQPEQGSDGRVRSLGDRLPPDLRQEAAGTASPGTPFTMVYELPDECAVELVHSRVHDVRHLGWVAADDGGYELRMAALVKPDGRLGRLRLAATTPLRHLVVHPGLTRRWERVWLERDQSRSAAAAPGSDGPRGLPLVVWAGRLIVLFGAAHTLGALTVEGAAGHAGVWWRGELWGDDLANMSAANSAYWLSLNSFGPPLVLTGATVLWLGRRGVAPPLFVPAALATWVVVDTVIAGPQSGQGLVLVLAAALLLAERLRPADQVSARVVVGPIVG